MENIYEYSKEENTRYSLGIKGENTLFCIGVNPSIATPKQYDRTIKKLEKIAELNGYDSWLMLNIYPQIATDPNDLDCNINNDYHEKNLQIIKKYINKNSNILCGWGNLITKRKYLKNCLKDIYEILNKYNNNYLKINDFTVKGNPRHISRQCIDNGLNKFDLDKYIKKNQ